MPAERAPLLSRLLLLLALAAVILATVWALRTAPDPDSDRYDYLARAWHLSEGQPPAPFLVYPLRLAYPEATSLPATNLTRPPLWPAILSVPMHLRIYDAAAVLCAAACLLALVGILFRASPSTHGGFAALVLATAFATWRALLGGGPELALALLLLVVWTWSGSSRHLTNVFVLGGLLGLMPWLHPVGWVYLGLGLGSRIWRDPASTIVQAGLLAVLIGIPWYLQVGQLTGEFLGPLQGRAELARAIHDGGGLNPYRTLEGIGAADVIASDPVGFLRHLAHNFIEQLRHLDGWLAWPLIALGLLGFAHDRWLALRDLVLICIGLLIVSAVAFDPRLLVPLLPVAALWVGVGVDVLGKWSTPGRVIGLLPVLTVLAWFVPLGLATPPGAELRETDMALRDPDRRSVVAYGQAGSPGQPCFSDSSVLAWRARRPGIAIPSDPATLKRILNFPALGKDPVLIASAGISGWWFRAPDWAPWWSAQKTSKLEGTPDGRIVELHPTPEFYVPEPLSLGQNDQPDSLATVPAPLAVREDLRLTPATLRSLSVMAAAARSDGVHLRVTSAYRSWQRQEQLWLGARERYGDDQRWVAAPGTSEHQLGTAVDFCDAAMQQVTKPGFAETAEGRWLFLNAIRFGWVRSYTELNEEYTGYRPEAWHYRFGIIPIDDE
jgi:hypothetical protein